MYLYKDEIEIPEDGNFCPNLEVRVTSDMPFPLNTCHVGACSINL